MMKLMLSILLISIACLEINGGFLSGTFPYFYNGGGSLGFGSTVLNPLVYTHQPLFHPVYTPIVYHQPQFFTIPTPKFYSLPTETSSNDDSNSSKQSSSNSQAQPSNTYGLPSSNSKVEVFQDDFKGDRRNPVIDTNQASSPSNYDASRDFQSFIVNRENNYQNGRDTGSAPQNYEQQATGGYQ